jgi:hypothetical protein
LQQGAIGEIIIIKDENQKRCMNCVEFLEEMKKPSFSVYFLPLIRLLDDIDRDNPGHNCRWQRLLKLREQLVKLNKICEKRLSPTLSGKEKLFSILTRSGYRFPKN